MDHKRKRAYRYLLYAAMLDIRPIEWFWTTGIRRFIPLLSRRQRLAIKRAGALADWLHNLAEFSAVEFDGFDEAWFWRDHDSVCSRHPELPAEGYRRMFEACINDPDAGCPGPQMWAALGNVGG